jgi:hypothetical protein
MEERRVNTIDEAKFATQKTVTYALLLIFAAVAGWVLYQNDQSERSMVLQTVINLTLLAVGYWLGASKAAADSNDAIGKIMKPQVDTMARIAEQAAPAQERAVAAARAPALPEAPSTAAAPPIPPAAGDPAAGGVTPVEIVGGAGTPGNEPLSTQEHPNSPKESP